MTLCINLPADVESTLRRQLGKGLEERAKQDLAAAWFREGRITSRQAAALLGMSLFDAHAFLKGKGALASHVAVGRRGGLGLAS
ncbi:MAG: hypothetical protein EHM61_21655 [Acidobacteria bacterium]|nr:MAG: hypothetical protein EHM61_21655 [Acidobacteriota bacterium]